MPPQAAPPTHMWWRPVRRRGVRWFLSLVVALGCVALVPGTAAAGPVSPTPAPGDIRTIHLGAFISLAGVNLVYGTGDGGAGHSATVCSDAVFIDQHGQSVRRADLPSRFLFDAYTHGASCVARVIITFSDAAPLGGRARISMAPTNPVVGQTVQITITVTDKAGTPLAHQGIEIDVETGEGPLNHPVLGQRAHTDTTGSLSASLTVTDSGVYHVRVVPFDDLGRPQGVLDNGAADFTVAAVSPMSLALVAIVLVAVVGGAVALVGRRRRRSP